MNLILDSEQKESLLWEGKRASALRGGFDFHWERGHPAQFPSLTKLKRKAFKATLPSRALMPL
jgi:hypothetical protein